jgi:hypothetical protein
LAFTATVHCLTGCAIGEVIGMVAGSALELSNHVTVVISITTPCYTLQGPTTDLSAAADTGFWFPLTAQRGYL